MVISLRRIGYSALVGFGIVATGAGLAIVAVMTIGMLAAVFGSQRAGTPWTPGDVMLLGAIPLGLCCLVSEARKGRNGRPAD